MARIIVLDSGPVGNLSRRMGDRDGDRCKAWLDGLELSGALVCIPEIVVYETRREFLRIRATGSLRRVDDLIDRLLFLPITRRVMELAASDWAMIRRAGLPTAPDDSLDADCILVAHAAEATGLVDSLRVATTNPGHLNRFPNIDARLWDQIA